MLPTVSLAQKLITFPTYGSNNAAYGACLALVDQHLESVPHLKSKSFTSKSFPSRVYYFNHPHRANLVLNGHLDVVAGKDNLFRPQAKHNQLWGRGAYDMKTAAAAFIDLFVTHHQLLQQNDVALMLVSDEEQGGLHGSKYILDQGFTCNCSLVGEPTNLQVVREAKGTMIVEIELPGESTHSARPWLGHYPITDLNHILNLLKRFYPYPQTETWAATAVVTKLDVVSISDTSTPELIKITINLRFPPPSDVTTTFAALQQKLQPYSLKLVRSSQPIYTKAANPYIRSFRRTLTQHHLPTAFRRGHGSADARYFTAKNIPSIGFGLNGAGAHSDHEWVDISTISTYQQVILDFIRKL